MSRCSLPRRCSAETPSTSCRSAAIEPVVESCGPVGTSRVVDEAHALHELHREETAVVLDEQLVEAHQIRVRHIGEASELPLQPIEVGRRRSAARSSARRPRRGRGRALRRRRPCRPRPAAASLESARCRGTAPRPRTADRSRSGGRSRNERVSSWAASSRITSGPSSGSPAQASIHVGRARGRLLQQRLVEDRPQAPMPVGGPAHGRIFGCPPRRRQRSRSPILACGGASAAELQMPQKKAASRVTTAHRGVAPGQRRGEGGAGHAGLSGAPSHCRPLHAAGAARPHAADDRPRQRDVLRLFGTAQTDWQSRAHFFAAVSREMRHILVDYARARDAKKRRTTGWRSR